MIAFAFSAADAMYLGIVEYTTNMVVQWTPLSSFSAQYYINIVTFIDVNSIKVSSIDNESLKMRSLNTYLESIRHSGAIYSL